MLGVLTTKILTTILVMWKPLYFYGAKLQQRKWLVFFYLNPFDYSGEYSQQSYLLLFLWYESLFPSFKNTYSKVSCWFFILFQFIWFFWTILTAKLLIIYYYPHSIIVTWLLGRVPKAKLAVSFFLNFNAFDFYEEYLQQS